MLNRRWFFDKQVYNDFVGRRVMDFGYQISWKAIDKGCLEVLGPFGVAATFRSGAGL